MKTRLCASVTAIALFATIGTAAAAGWTTVPKKDALKLTSTQRHEIYRDVSKEKMSQVTPAKFTARVGETVPSSIKLDPLPASATKQVPAVRSYDYAMLRKKVILVNPSSKKIADVITQ